MNIRSIFFILFSGLLVSFSGMAQSSDGLKLIGNNTGLSSVNKKQLNAIFQGSRSLWQNGEEVQVVMPSARTDFSEQFSLYALQRSYPALQKFWLGLVFQGRANAPVFLNSSAEILDYVKRNPGAIGMVKMPEKEISPELLIPVTER
jgi:ABC-type phosphate transport system substrate-binding protein